MHVKIGYSIDLKEVPARVRTLMEEVKGAVEKDIPQKYRVSLHALKDTEDYLETIEKIEELREMLFSADLRLADCASILHGYQEALLNKGVPQVAQPAILVDPPDEIEPPIPSSPVPRAAKKVTQNQAQEVVDQFKDQVSEYTKNFVAPPSSSGVPANPEEQAAAAMEMLQNMFGDKK